MKNVYRKVLTLCACMCFGMIPVSAYTPQNGEAIFSYNPDPQRHNGFGVGDGDGHFDVAIKIDAGVFKGNKIKGVCVPFGNTDMLMNMSAWVATNLNINDDYVQRPDVAKKEFFYQNTESSNGKVGFAEVLFDEPIEIKDQDLYVGYTFFIVEHNQGNDEPIIITNVRNTEGKSLFVQTEGWKWKDVVSMGYTWSSSLQVIMETPENGVAIQPVTALYVQPGASPKVDLTVYRTGTQKVNTIDYDVTVNGQTNSYTYNVPDNTTINSSDIITYPGYAFPVTFPEFVESGEYNTRITITGVNGEANGSKAKTVNTKVRVAGFVPVKIPVMEEVTCTACPNCTRGIYAMNVMDRLHRESDDFIGIVYHNSDQWGGQGEPMHVLETKPIASKGNPTILCDRRFDTADFYGQNIKTSITVGLEEAWQERKKVQTPAALRVSADWKDDTKEELVVTGEARFISDAKDAKFKLDLILIHDGMSGHGSYWDQRNAYNGVFTFSNEPEWAEICNGGTTIKGLEFQEVYVSSASGTAGGVEGSVPANIKEGSPVTFTHTFKMSEMKNLLGKSMIQNKKALRVVALLIDDSGAIANGAKAKVPGYDYVKKGTIGIDTPSAADTDRQPVGYYDLMGRSIERPSQGIFVVRYNDGTTEKRVIR